MVEQAAEALTGQPEDPAAQDQYLQAQLQVAAAGLHDHPDYHLPDLDKTVVPKVGSIKAHVDKFLEAMRTAAKLGNRSMNRADNLRRYLQVLLDWEHSGIQASHRNIDAIAPSFVEDY